MARGAYLFQQLHISELGSGCNCSLPLRLPRAQALSARGSLLPATGVLLPVLSSSCLQHLSHYLLLRPSPPSPFSSSPSPLRYLPPANNPGPSPLLKAYLLAFNALSALLWARLLFLTVWFILTPRTHAAHRTVFGHSASGQQPWASIAALADHLSGGYDFHGLGEATKYTQTLAIMEVVHAALGWVRSPVGTVASQVASRLWAVWGVVEPVMSVSWLWAVWELGREIWGRRWAKEGFGVEIR